MLTAILVLSILILITLVFCCFAFVYVIGQNNAILGLFGRDVPKMLEDVKDIIQKNKHLVGIIKDN